MPFTIDDIADLANLRKAVRFALQDKGDEAVLDPLRDIPFLENLDSRLTDISERLKAGDYEPRGVTIVELPKGNYTTRPISQLSMEDWVVAQAILNVVAERLDSLIPVTSFAMRLNPKRDDSPRQQFFKGWYREWPRFLRRIRRMVSSRLPCLVVADISGYFEHIDLDQLKEIILAARVPPEIADLISNQVQRWTWRDRYSVDSSRGLLQGTDIASLYANVYLHDIDSFFVKNGVDHQRYIDDFNFHVADAAEGKRLLGELTRILRRKGLSLNAAKTAVLCDSEIETHFNFDVGDRLERHLDDLKTNGDLPRVRAERNALRRVIYGLKVANPHLFKRLITAYTRARAGRFLNEALRLLVHNPDLTPNLCKYFRAMDTDRVLDGLISFLEDPARNLFPGQEQQLLETLFLMSLRQDRHRAHLAQLARGKLGNRKVDAYSRALYVFLMYKVAEPNEIVGLVDTYLGRRETNAMVKKHLALTCTRLVDPSRFGRVVERLKRETDPDLTETGIFMDEIQNSPPDKLKSIMQRTRMRRDFYHNPPGSTVDRLDLRDLVILNLVRESNDTGVRGHLRRRLQRFRRAVSCPRAKALLEEALSRI